MRNIIGGLLALVGAALTLVSPWQPWYNNRHGSTYKFYEVFGSGITPSGSGIMDSVFLVFLVTAALTVVGVLLGSRALVGFAAVVAFGFAVLWMVRQGQAAGELTVTGANNRGLGSGVAYAFAGGLLMVIGSLVMVGRPRRAVVADRPAATTATAATAADQNAYGAGSTRTGTTATPAITATAPADRNPAAPPQAPAERTGTERLSKEERSELRRLMDVDEYAKPIYPWQDESALLDEEWAGCLGAQDTRRFFALVHRLWKQNPNVQRILDAEDIEFLKGGGETPRFREFGISRHLMNLWNSKIKSFQQPCVFRRWE